ncbi:hypothetical protein GDO81_013694 [Engystomops pustulosus]|uniref:Uncharacterized protein n=1 Tax=Engystomops pustulosus TaxID=76066 RepID=A0AAV7B4X4_ENGPU|nr:hypothetical protein GDO81_013694 [Engystomops pustulosus]
MKQYKAAEKKIRERSVNNKETLEKTKNEYEAFLSIKAQHKMFFQGQRYFSEGGRAGKILAQRVSVHRENGYIPAIRSEGGGIEKDPLRVREQFKGFYEKLYRSTSELPRGELEGFFGKDQFP